MCPSIQASGDYFFRETVDAIQMRPTNIKCVLMEQTDDPALSIYTKGELHYGGIMGSTQNRTTRNERERVQQLFWGLFRAISKVCAHSCRLCIWAVRLFLLTYHHV